MNKDLTVSREWLKEYAQNTARNEFVGVSWNWTKWLKDRAQFLREVSA